MTIFTIYGIRENNQENTNYMNFVCTSSAIPYLILSLATFFYNIVRFTNQFKILKS